mgnify:FL=1
MWVRYKELSGVRLSNSDKLLIPTRKLHKHFADAGKTTYAGIYEKPSAPQECGAEGFI